MSLILNEFRGFASIEALKIVKFKVINRCECQI